MPERKQVRRKRNHFIEVWRRMKKSKLAMTGLAILIVFVLAAVFADVIVDYDKGIKLGSERLMSPSAEHWFGTDHLGRDVFARIIHGARVSLTLGLATTFISLVIGGLFGATAGFFGGAIDNFIMRVMDMIMCIPAILLALAIIAALGTSITNLLIAITVASVPGFTRIIRSAVLSVVGNEYIEAARACGMNNIRIIVRHIIPNAIGPIIVEATMAIAGMIITAASLSFLGMGIQPPDPEWGAMLSEAKDFMRQKPYLVMFPGLSIVLSALSLNLLGDGLRDALDPRLKS